MRIAIDAKWYYTGPVSGRVVLQNLLPELFSQYPEHEWIIFLDRKDRHLGFPFSGKNVQIRYVWADMNMISNVWVIPRWLRRLKPDVMVYQTFPSFRREIPSIAFIHDVLFRKFPQFFSWKERLYFLPLAWLTRHRADRLIATTEFVANELLTYHYCPARSRIDIVPLGVSEKYQPKSLQDVGRLSTVRAKFNLPDRFILYVGRLNVRKNIESLLKALPLLRDKEAKLVIVGSEDWKAPDLQQLLSRPDIGERIMMTGSMSDEELIVTYCLATVFCFPSFAEGFGLPPLEAMASGVPVIVSGTTSLPEVCGDAAVFIDPSKPDTIARAIDELFNDPELYERKRRSGLERAGQYTWPAAARALMSSINNTVGR